MRGTVCRLMVVSVLLPLANATPKEKDAVTGQADNGTVGISATAYTTKEQIDALIGSDMGGFYTVLDVTVTPKNGKLKIDNDDFVLLTFKDGEKTHPMEPSQISGGADFVVHQVKVGPRGPGADNNGTVYMPGGMGSSAGMGSRGASNATTTTTTAAPKSARSGKSDPLLDVLKARVLPQKEVGKAVSGLLIFNLEKQKAKDLELIYNTAEGPLKISFR